MQEQQEARIVIVDEDCCCECNEIELYTDRDPEIVLFDEYSEQYIDDIVAARIAAEEAREAVETSAATIIEKENLLLDDHQTIKRELRQGISDIRSDIASAEVTIVGAVSDAESSIKSKIANAVITIGSAITSAKDALSAVISSAKDAVQGSITTAVEAIKSYIDGKTNTIRADIQALQFPTFTEASEADIEAMFDGLDLPEED